MRKTKKSLGEQIVKDIKRATLKHYSSEEKIRIVLDGLRDKDSIAELCRREGISESLHNSWSKEFLEAGKQRLAGDTALAASTNEVKDLRREARDLKEVVVENTLEVRLLKKHDRRWGRPKMRYAASDALSRVGNMTKWRNGGTGSISVSVQAAARLVLQASFLDCLRLDLLSLSQDFSCSAVIDVNRCQVAKTLLISPVVV